MHGLVLIHPIFLIFLSLSILIVPLPVFAAIAAAAVIHECAHFLMCCFLGGNITGFQLHPTNALLCVELPKTWQRIAATAAGPLSSLMLALCCLWMPKLALSGLIQGLFNFLPVYPLDGGRILRELLQIKFSKRKAECIGNIVAIASALLLSFVFFRMR